MVEDVDRLDSCLTLLFAAENKINPVMAAERQGLSTKTEGESQE